MPFDLDRFVPYLLTVAATRVSRRFARRYADEAGVSVPEWRVLAHLHRAGEMSVRDIHLRVNLDKSVVSRAAARLGEAGLLRKSGNDADRRLIVLALTPEGRALMDRLGDIADAFQTELLAELGPDADAFVAVLARLAADPDPDAGAAPDR